MYIFKNEYTYTVGAGPKLMGFVTDVWAPHPWIRVSAQLSRNTAAVLNLDNGARWNGEKRHSPCNCHAQ